MDTISGTGRIRTDANVVLLDLNQPPFVLVAWSEDEEVAEVLTSESGWADGDTEDNYRLLATVIEVMVRIECATWPEVEQQFHMVLKPALKAASTWLLEREMEGVSIKWRARRPLLISSPTTTEDVLNHQRTVTFRVPVQPTVSITGLPEEP